MKKVLLALVATIVCTLSALGQTPRQMNEFKQVTSGNGLYTWQERRNSAELNGKYHIVKDAQTYFLTTFKNGLQDGVEECYKHNTLESRTNYILGLQCGEEEEYSTFAESRGKLIKKCSYNNKGQLDGTCTMYFTNGNVQSVCTYRDGKMVGDEYHYSPDGKVREEYHVYEKYGKTYKSSFSCSNERVLLLLKSTQVSLEPTAE